MLNRSSATTASLIAFVVLKVMNLIPSEADGEPLEEAMARVRRCINGGGGQGPGDNDDGSDSDLEVMAEYISVNLRCPVRIMLLCDASSRGWTDTCALLTLFVL